MYRVTVELFHLNLLLWVGHARMGIDTYYNKLPNKAALATRTQEGVTYNWQNDVAAISCHPNTRWKGLSLDSYFIPIKAPRYGLLMNVVG